MSDHPTGPSETDAELAREVLDDDDAELAAFFAGEDMTGPLVPDGGKGLVLNDPIEAG